MPDPLYERLKTIAAQQDWSLGDVMRRAAEQFASRFPEPANPARAWRFPTLDCGGDFLTDPASLHPETEVIARRTGS